MFFHLDFRHIFDIEFVYAYIFDICILDFYIFYTFVWDTYIIDTCVFDTYIFDPWFLRHQYFLDTYICWQLTTAKTEPEIRHLGYDKNTLNNATNHPLKGDGRTMTYVTGYVLAKISIFGSIFVIRPSKLVIRPNFTLRAGGGGTSSRQNGWKRNWYDFGVIFDEKFEFRVHFGELAPYGGHPPHIHPSNRVEGVQVTAKMDGNTSGMVFGWFLTRNSNIRFILVNQPPMAVIHISYTPQTGWRDASYRQNGWKH